MQIVLARTIRRPNRYGTFSGPKLFRAQSIMWMSEGSLSDKAAAERYVKKLAEKHPDEPTYEVYVYPPSEPDPMHRAKLDHLKSQEVSYA